MGTTLVVAIFYCLDALHGERRDRSILFWKSLPVSDFTTVLSKASIPIVVLSLLTFAVTVVIHWIMLLSSVVLLSSGQSVSALWTHLSPTRMWLILFYHLLALHGFWYAPFYGWRCWFPPWVRRMPFLWAALPPLAIGVVEKVAFNTSHFAALLGNRFSGGPRVAAAGGGMSMDSLTPLAPAQFLISPGLWVGMAVTAAFLAAAVQLRRNHGPI